MAEREKKQVEEQGGQQVEQQGGADSVQEPVVIVERINGRFAPGVSGNPKGAKKGRKLMIGISPAKTIKEKLRAAVPDAIDFLAKLVKDESARKADRVAAAKLLLERVVGAKVTIEGGEKPIEIRVEEQMAEQAVEDAGMREALLKILEYGRTARNLRSGRQGPLPSATGRQALSWNREPYRRTSDMSRDSSGCPRIHAGEDVTVVERRHGLGLIGGTGGAIAEDAREN